MIEHGHPQVSIVRQCELLKLSRSSVYYVPREQCQEDLDLMYLIDQQHLETPYYGSRKMRVHLERKGHLINRKRVQRLMRTMGIQAVYPRPRTSIPGDGAYSRPRLPLIPDEACHPFHAKAATDSTAKLPPWQAA